MVQKPGNKTVKFNNNMKDNLDKLDYQRCVYKFKCKIVKTFHQQDTDIAMTNYFWILIKLLEQTFIMLIELCILKN